MRPGLIPGHNVDRLSIRKGLEEAAVIGYDDRSSQMVVGYALLRHARGEEDGCQRTMLSHGINLTSYYRILAAALAAIRPHPPKRPVPEGR